MFMCILYFVYIDYLHIKNSTPKDTQGRHRPPPPPTPHPTAAAVGAAVRAQVTGELFLLEVPLEKQPAPHGG